MSAHQEAASRPEHALACAERAKRLARVERHDDANRALDEGLRAIAGLAVPSVASVALDIACATLHYFADREEVSIDVLRKACADARAIGARSLEAECSATLALHLLQVGRSREALVQAAHALYLARADDHAAIYRACLAVANMCQFEGAPSHAFPYYRRALQAASALGDKVATRAIIARMGNEQAVEAMRLDLLGQLDDETLKQAIVGVHGGMMWESGSVPSLEAIDRLAMAMLLRRRGDAQQADALFEHWMPRLTAAQCLDMQGSLLSEHARCRLALGDHEGAQDLALRARDLIERDDASATRARLLDNVAVVLRACAHRDTDAVAAEARLALERAQRQREARMVELEAQWAALRLGE